MSETGRYLYAVGRPLAADDLDGLTGLRDQPLEQVPLRDLVAVVSSVPLSEFGEQPLTRNLEDLTWLEEVARRHDQVVQEVARRGPTAPLRLATICLDDAGVRRLLEEWYADIETVLARIDGRAEWSVKVVVPPDAELVPSGAGPDGESGESGGAAYLRRKKAMSEARQAHRDRTARLGEIVHEQLVGGAVASRLLRPQDPQLSGHAGTMVLNGAYLVEESETGAFEARVAELVAAHPDVTIDHGGPWPPYSFAVLEQS